MYKKLFLTAALIAACASTNAQSIATDYKGSGNNNPLSANIFCADPTALEYNGRLYVYGSNDHQEFMANNKKNDNTYGNIKSIVVFSTDDMVNWTFHGTIDTKKICSSWTNNPWYVGYGVSWAPSVTWRHNETTDKDEFFLYFCNSSHGVGVLKAESPIGPWKSPNNKLMIHRDTPGATPCSAVFDPGVTVDENGVGWISFGGLDPVDGGDSFNPKNARIVKLKNPCSLPFRSKRTELYRWQVCLYLLLKLGQPRQYRMGELQTGAWHHGQCTWRWHYVLYGQRQPLRPRFMGLQGLLWSWSCRQQPLTPAEVSGQLLSHLSQPRRHSVESHEE